MIQLSQSKINSWAACERQFQLRYVEKHEWPNVPYSAGSTEAMELGEMFHMLVAQRIMLGAQFEPPNGLERPLIEWWDNFVGCDLFPILDAPNLVKRVETSLSVQVNETIKLFGRVDLLITSDNSIEIYDWKTGRPRSKLDLEQDWQTRIYLALLYQSARAISDRDIAIEDVSMRYWYAREPKKSVKVYFDEAWHVQNWAEIKTVADQIAERSAGSQIIWPLTNNLSLCRRCSFNSLCGRESASQSVANDLEDDELIELLPAEIEVHPDI